AWKRVTTGTARGLPAVARAGARAGGWP
ncbi:hypothetical protein A2U01_0110707, partial [Trifolium medium]|nr:hypothetical protein [Trifolium medium]